MESSFQLVGFRASSDSSVGRRGARRPCGESPPVNAELPGTKPSMFA